MTDDREQFWAVSRNADGVKLADAGPYTIREAAEMYVGERRPSQWRVESTPIGERPGIDGGTP